MSDGDTETDDKTDCCTNTFATRYFKVTQECTNLVAQPKQNQTRSAHLEECNSNSTHCTFIPSSIMHMRGQNEIGTTKGALSERYSYEQKTLKAYTMDGNVDETVQDSIQVKEFFSNRNRRKHRKFTQFTSRLPLTHQLREYCTADNGVGKKDQKYTTLTSFDKNIPSNMEEVHRRNFGDAKIAWGKYGGYIEDLEANGARTDKIIDIIGRENERIFCVLANIDFLSVYTAHLLVMFISLHNCTTFYPCMKFKGKFIV
ncbi:unnamed protein product [Mytilus edulis]|uniref:Uncharacterized protein n=1 Tax=Mytilus edulis TaxID=6550 RepID=A0A8S3VE89_MYTED|nr:unnamed protein product [Mytilus edulis]